MNLTIMVKTKWDSEADESTPTTSVNLSNDGGFLVLIIVGLIIWGFLHPIGKKKHMKQLLLIFCFCLVAGSCTSSYHCQQYIEYNPKDGDYMPMMYKALVNGEVIYAYEVCQEYGYYFFVVDDFNFNRRVIIKVREERVGYVERLDQYQVSP